MLKLHAQPFKTLYLVYRGVAVLLKLPAWLVLSALPVTRQRHSWDFTRSLAVRVLKDAVSIMFTVYAFPVPPLNAGEGAKGDWVWAEPVPHLVLGDIKEAATVNGIESAQVYGCMQSLDEGKGSGSRSAKLGEKIIYYLHGGAYVMCDASPDGPSGYFVREWLKEAPTVSRAFQINYRLSQGPPLKPANPFPAALIDALAGYNYLVHTLGFDPQNIILAGESAGAHLAVTLTRYLVLNALPGLPPPRALMLASPVSDWGGSHIGRECWVRNESTDMCQPCMVGFAPRALRGSLPEEYARTSPWMSPGSLDIVDPRGIFKGFPTTLIVGGGAECLLDQIRTLKDRMTDDLGEDKVTYLEVPDSLHAFVTLSWHEPERSHTTKQIAEWSTRVCSV